MARFTLLCLCRYMFRLIRTNFVLILRFMPYPYGFLPILTSLGLFFECIFSSQYILYNFLLHLHKMRNKKKLKKKYDDFSCRDHRRLNGLKTWSLEFTGPYTTARVTMNPANAYSIFYKREDVI